MSSKVFFLFCGCLALFITYFVISELPRANVQVIPNRRIFKWPLDAGCEKEKLRVRKFKKTLLVLTFNFPFYNNIPYLRQMYGDVFGKVVMCGSKPKSENATFKPDITTEINAGYFGYHCAAEALERYPGYEGYMYGNDDMIINWWNLLDRDADKIWQGPRYVDFRQPAFGKIINTAWIWWNSHMGLKPCQEYYQYLKKLSNSSMSNAKLLNTFLKNGNGSAMCGKGWADYFYIPGKFRSDFVQLANTAFKHGFFLEIAVNNILRTLDDVRRFEILDGVYLPDVGFASNVPSEFWKKSYTLNLTFIHPYKMNVGDRSYNLHQLHKNVINHTRALLSKGDC